MRGNFNRFQLNGDALLRVWWDELEVLLVVRLTAGRAFSIEIFVDRVPAKAAHLQKDLINILQFISLRRRHAGARGSEEDGKART